MMSNDIESEVAKRGFSVPSATLALVVGICTIILGLQASRTVEQRAEALAAGKTETANLAMSLTQHVDLTFRAADTILAGLVERLQARDHKNNEGSTRLRAWFDGVLERHSHIAGLSMADNTGQVLISSENADPRMNVADREYFRRHLEMDTRELFVGAPIFGRVQPGWVVPVSRRFNEADGSFAGVMTAFLDMASLQKFYEQFDIGKEGAILLLSSDNKVLIRRPFVESNIGRDISQSNIAKALQHAASGTIEIRAITDGVARLNSYRSSEKYPVVIAVAKSIDEILSPWRNRAIREITVTSILLIIIAIAGRLVSKMASGLASAKQQLDMAIDAMPQGLCVFDASRRLVLSNDRFRELYGYPPTLMKPGTPFEVILSDVARRGAAQGDMSVRQYAEGISTEGSETVFNIDGRLIAIVRKPAPGGGWVATHEDITEQKRDQQILARQAAELRRVNEYFESAINNMPHGICLYDAEQRVIVANTRYAELYNLTSEEIKPGTTLQQILNYRTENGTNFGVAAEVYRSINIKKTHEVQDLADGRTVSISRRLLSDGGWLTIHEDITERRKDERQIAYLAAHDPLTALPNRATFMDALATAAKCDGGYSAIFLLDLDRFKAVNDTLGHAAGDQLLKEVAGRLSSSIREGDTVARLGGDEFAIIQRLDNASHEAAISLALRIIGAIAKPFELDGHVASVGTSIGIVLCPEQGTDRSDLMKKADLALYAVKADGRNDFRIYDAAMMKAMEQQRLLETELAQAIEREEFELYYQPIIDTKTSRIMSAEALIRWHHPQHGLLSPDKFIPLAEETGLIVPLGEWVLQQGCRDAATWPENLRVAINLSVHQFKPGNLFDVVLCTLLESGLSPDRLELEVTESALLDRQFDDLQTLRQLRNIGITIVLDDFGTGYSSAKYLTHYPFEKIKIDKSVVQGVGTQRESSAIIASTLALARGMDIAVTAEGVETQEQLHQLSLAGVDFAQGYLIGRPMTLGEFTGDAQSPVQIFA